MKIIPLEEFIRTFDVRPNQSFDFLLGAGASSQAGIPTASDIIWFLKRKIFCTKHKIHEEVFRDIGLQENREKLQKYFDSEQKYPQLGHLEEYSSYFEECYPNWMDRKHFIQRFMIDIKPSLGHLCIGAMVLQARTETIWTTNFDELVENGIKTLNPNKSLAVISPENVESIAQINDSLPRVYKLHGDFRYDKLQNTNKETKGLNDALNSKLNEISQAKGLIVVGYSGRDESIISALKNAINTGNPFPHGIIWCIRKGESPIPQVKEVIELADNKNKQSGFVEIDGFDDFLYRLYQACNLKNAVIDDQAINLFKIRQPFLEPGNTNIDTVKLNGIKIVGLPKTVCSFDTDIQSWEQLRSVCGAANIVAGLFKGKIQFFGDIKQIPVLFGQHVKSEISFIDIDERWLRNENSVIFGMLYDVIGKSLEDKYKMKRVGIFRENRIFYKDEFRLMQADLGRAKVSRDYEVFEAFEFQLVFFENNNYYFVLLPTVFVKVLKNLVGLDEQTRKRIDFEKQSIINAIISGRYNKQVNEKLNFWLDYFNRIDKQKEFSIGEFKIKLDDKYCHAKYKLCHEPSLCFHVSDTSLSIVHPLKGLKSWGPYDLSLQQSTNTTVKLALILPQNKHVILRHLNQLNSQISPSSEKDYLIDFPGFNQLFKKTLEVPQLESSKLMVTIKDDELKGLDALRFYDLLKRKVDYFDSIRGEFDILVIFIPEAWRIYREVKNESVYFDLHDSIKIYCAKKNIKAQVIEEKSTGYFDQAKVRWTLSLGTYVKANGVPWKLKPVSENTAYIGIGYSVKNEFGKNQVVMGFSQIFDESGQGFRFLLSPLENPIFRGKNPYMSREDTRRFVSQLRETYYKMNPNLKLKKVVIHKTTHFTNEEIEGIVQALSGIENIELLQIQQLNKWKGIRGDLIKKEAHPYPINRGAVVRLDDNNCLIWTHGAIVHDKIAGTNKNYYQGARGIPTPLLIKRFRGKDTLEETAEAILNLTKMNWNSGQLYKILPVTLDFSKSLSRMAKQTESLYNQLYDFRFFM